MTPKQETSPKSNFTISEKGGLDFLRDSDLSIYSPGISTAGRIEKEMVVGNPPRTVIGTTIDKGGFKSTFDNVRELGLDNQIFVKLQDLRDENSIPSESIDYIYARLVLHYLPKQDLDFALRDFYRILKQNSRLFVVVRSVNNIPEDGGIEYDEETGLTTIIHPNGFPEIRYFHTPGSISTHIQKAGFDINSVKEYKEQLYIDFARTQLSEREDHLIEVCASKV